MVVSKYLTRFVNFCDRAVGYLTVFHPRHRVLGIKSASIAVFSWFLAGNSFVVMDVTCRQDERVQVFEM